MVDKNPEIAVELHSVPETIISPLLAHTIKDMDALKYPLLCSKKIDGLRALTVNGKLVSRTFKPIRNHHISSTLESILPDGLDGELISGNFNESQSAIMRADGKPQFKYHVFDYMESDPSVPFADRYKQLQSLDIFDNDYVELVPHYNVCNKADLLSYEEVFLKDGMEGVMCRDLDGIYKFGRSTEKQGILGKLKRFTDAEAVVIGFEEKMHNGNEATVNVFGRTERSSHKDNKTPLDTLGALVVEFEGNQFKIGTGMDDDTRKDIWKNRDSAIGRLVKFKYQDAGMKNLPRFPVYIGWRDEDDM